jgi:hypothetical protein
MTMPPPPIEGDSGDEAAEESAPPEPAFDRPFRERPMGMPAPEPAATAAPPPVLAGEAGPPTRQQAAEAPRGDDAARQRLRGLVRDARAHAQAILDELPAVRTALALTDEAARDAELADALRELRHVARDRIESIDQCRREGRAVLDAAPAVYDAIGDAVTNLDTAWERARRALERLSGKDAAIVRARLDEVEAAITRMMWEAALVTMPPRVNAHLATLDVGGQLDFGEAFSDELPTDSARKRFLEVLRSHPGSVAGAVDAERGVIYKAAQGPRRVFSYVLLLVLAGPLALLFINFVASGSSQLGVPRDWLFAGANRQSELWNAYVFVVLGVVFHLLVEGVKQAQRSTNKAFLALGHWMTWIHVREMSLAITILTMWAIPIGLALTLSGDRIDVATAFFAGYSIDSIIGIFLTRFDGLAKSSSQAVLTRISPAPASPGPAG